MAKSTTVTTAKSGPSPRRFFGDITGELKKVTWLSRREVAYLTGVVIIMTVIAGAALGFIDLGFSKIISQALGG
jgi:preprotein translocase subunit SecE